MGFVGLYKRLSRVGFICIQTGGPYILIVQLKSRFVKTFYEITYKNFKTLDKSLQSTYNGNIMANYLAEKKDRNLTEKQQSFLNHLVETGGDFKKSAELAGYSGNHYQVLRSLREEVVDLASDVLAREAPTAAFKIIEVMKSDKPVPQANNKLQAAQTILDRVGVSKTDRIDVNHTASNGIFILPEKKAINVPEADYEEINDEDISN